MYMHIQTHRYMIINLFSLIQLKKSELHKRYPSFPTITQNPVWRTLSQTVRGKPSI